MRRHDTSFPCVLCLIIGFQLLAYFVKINWIPRKRSPRQLNPSSNKTSKSLDNIIPGLHSVNMISNEQKMYEWVVLLSVSCLGCLDLRRLIRVKLAYQWTINFVRKQDLPPLAYVPMNTTYPLTSQVQGIQIVRNPINQNYSYDRRKCEALRDRRRVQIMGRRRRYANSNPARIKNIKIKSMKGEISKAECK